MNHLQHKLSNVRRLAAAACMALCAACPAAAQRIGFKTNALYWAAASPNLGLELRVNRHMTFDIEGTYNRLDIGRYDTRAMIFTPEVRYWLSARPQAGHFIGATGFAADYNIAIGDTRHKGDAFGAGITYGYSFVLSRHWSLELTAGAGMAYRHEKSFDKNGSEPEAVNVRKWQLAPMKAGVSFVYILK